MADGKREYERWQCVCHSGRTFQAGACQHEKGTGEEGFLEFMLEDVEKALKETEMPVMGMMYYNVPDMGIVPRLREGNNDDYLQRLEKAMDGHGIKLHRYLRLSEVVYCL